MEYECWWGHNVARISDNFINEKRRHSILNFGGLLMRMRNFVCRKLWTAPEILRSEDPPVGGTQKATDGSYKKKISDRRGYNECLASIT